MKQKKHEIKSTNNGKPLHATKEMTAAYKAYKVGGRKGLDAHMEKVWAQREKEEK